MQLFIKSLFVFSSLALTFTAFAGAADFDADRNQHAPLGKLLYAIDKDGTCHKSNFSQTKDGVELRVSSRKHVSGDHCIYGSGLGHVTAKEDVEGFALFARDGGLCVPVHASLTHHDWTVIETGSAVPLQKCFDQQHTDARVPAMSEVESSRLGFSKVVEQANTDVTGANTVDLLHEAHTVALNNDPKDSNTVLAPAKPEDTKNAETKDTETKIAESKKEEKTEAHALSNAEILAHFEDVPAERPVAVTQINKAVVAPVNKTEIAKPAVTKSETAKSESVAPGASVKSNHSQAFTVQLASFLSEDDAKAKVSWLKTNGLDSFVMVASVNGMSRYRVCVGHYQGRKSAKVAMASVLEKSGFTEALVQKVTSDEGAVAAAEPTDSARNVNSVDESKTCCHK